MSKTDKNPAEKDAAKTPARRAAKPAAETAAPAKPAKKAGRTSAAAGNPPAPPAAPASRELVQFPEASFRAGGRSGKYVYCIIQTTEPRRFGSIGIGSEP